MSGRTPSYKEGGVFLVPLSDGGYARGVIARVGKRGILLGYFFGPKVFDQTSSMRGLIPQEALWRGRFGDLGLLQGSWPLIGAIEPWDRSAWAIPEFLWSDPLGQLPDEVVVYTDADFDSGTAGRRERRAIPQGLEQDGLAGHRYVEVRLTRLLEASIRSRS